MFRIGGRNHMNTLLAPLQIQDYHLRKVTLKLLCMSSYFSLSISLGLIFLVPVLEFYCSFKVDYHPSNSQQVNMLSISQKQQKSKYNFPKILSFPLASDFPISTHPFLLLAEKLTCLQCKAKSTAHVLYNFPCYLNFVSFLYFINI